MTPEEFDAHFDRFHRSAVRVEAQPAYIAPGEAERIEAFRHGTPRPVRSVRTEPWLARIAVTTATEGKRWLRVRVVDDPMTEYQKYRLPGDVESQAAGEEVFIAPRSASPDLARVTADFWGFDLGSASQHALRLLYDSQGTWQGADLVTDLAVLRGFQADLECALRWAVPLNEYLAREGRRAA